MKFAMKKLLAASCFFTVLLVSCDLGLLDKDVSFFPSIETVNGKLKKFNDAFYAGVVLAFEIGFSDFLSKPFFKQSK